MSLITFKVFLVCHILFSSNVGLLIEPIVLDEDNFMLRQILDDEEILKAVKGIGCTKASGLDGITTLFFKHN
jgi:hypothetical protein